MRAKSFGTGHFGDGGEGGVGWSVGDNFGKWVWMVGLELRRDRCSIGRGFWRCMGSRTLGPHTPQHCASRHTCSLLHCASWTYSDCSALVDRFAHHSIHCTEVLQINRNVSIALLPFYCNIAVYKCIAVPKAGRCKQLHRGTIKDNNHQDTNRKIDPALKPSLRGIISYGPPFNNNAARGCIPTDRIVPQPSNPNAGDQGQSDQKK